MAIVLEVLTNKRSLIVAKKGFFINIMKFGLSV